jgi:hypothetical protein
MAHRSRAVPIKPDFGRDTCKSFRVTFWTAHDNTSDIGGVNNAIRSLPEPYSENCPESIPLLQLAYQSTAKWQPIPYAFPNMWKTQRIYPFWQISAPSGVETA